MKKTVEEKAEIAKQKIDSKLQKQKQKKEKAALKKEKAANKKAAKKDAASVKKAAKKDAKQQKKAAKKEISSGKKDLKAQQKSAKKEAAKIKKQQKQEAKNKMKELKAKAKQPKETSSAEQEQETSSEKTTKTKKSKKAAKTKEAKKPKKGKKGKDDAVEKGGSKKILFIALLALVFAGSGVAGFLHFKGGEKEENADPYLEAYVLDDDFIMSIPKFLEQSETRALPEITIEDDTDNNKKIIYDYTGLKGAAKEVKDYINYLTEENEFVPMFDFNLDAPAGYISVGTASTEEGKTLKIDIDYTDSDYKVMMSKTTETLPKPKTNNNAKDSGTRDGALNYLTSIASDTLGLEKPVEEYKAIYDPGQSSINEGSFYGINLYEPNQIGTNEFIGKFFVATNQSSIFRYNSAENSYTEVVNKKASSAKNTESIEIAEATAEDIANNTERAENTENTEETEEKQKDEKKNDHQKGQKPEREETEEKKTKSKGR